LRLKLGEIDIALLVERNEAKPLSRAATMGYYLVGHLSATGTSLIFDSALARTGKVWRTYCSTSSWNRFSPEYVKEIDNPGFLYVANGVRSLIKQQIGNFAEGLTNDFREHIII
jgi:hypothetical protein